MVQFQVLIADNDKGSDKTNYKGYGVHPNCHE